MGPEVGEGLEAYALPKIHDRVVEILARRPTRGRLLDAGAGSGALAVRLKALGYAVEACDLDPTLFKAREIPFRPCDLNQALPYPEASFDLVVSVETIEHLENHFQFVRECHRVLKAGGWLLLTTPNLVELHSRIFFLFTGFFQAVRPVNEMLHEARRDPLHDHVGPLTYSLLRHLLHVNGFRIALLAANRLRKSAWAWSWLYPALRVATPLALRKQADPAQRQANRELVQEMLSRPVLLGRVLIVGAERLADA